jgi:2-(1,2-epoxy-1,2-dihydrophenyl)acetyl-CoA isomerase
MDAPVCYEFDASTGVATVAFNRPSVFNALDVATAKAFEEATARAQVQDGLRCLVLTGRGKAFMAGGDVSAFAADLDGAGRTLSLILNHMHPALLALRKLDAPIIAAVNGVAAGAGLSVVLSADIAVAHPDARFVMAYDKLGVPPDCGGTWFLARKVGRSKAFEMMLLGITLSAEQARDAGIVTRVAEADEFERSVQDVVTKVASGPTVAYGRFKQLMDETQSYAAQMESERESFLKSIRTADFREAASAFVEKRGVSFVGS